MRYVGLGKGLIKFSAVVTSEIEGLTGAVFEEGHYGNVLVPTLGGRFGNVRVITSSNLDVSHI